MVLFSEKQKFRQWWLWLLLLLPFAITMFRNYQENKTIALDFKAIDLMQFIPLIVIWLLFVLMSLKTEIKTEGVFVRFFPFHLKSKFFPWNEIAEIYVRQYKPLWEYGGWGLRVGLFGKGNAYNVSGNIGIQIIFTNGKKLLLGTQSSELVNNALQQLGKYQTGI